MSISLLNCLNNEQFRQVWIRKRSRAAACIWTNRMSVEAGPCGMLAQILMSIIKLWHLASLAASRTLRHASWDGSQKVERLSCTSGK